MLPLPVTGDSTMTNNNAHVSLGPKQPDLCGIHQVVELLQHSISIEVIEKFQTQCRCEIVEVNFKNFVDQCSNILDNPPNNGRVYMPFTPFYLDCYKWHVHTIIIG